MVDSALIYELQARINWLELEVHTLRKGGTSESMADDELEHYKRIGVSSLKDLEIYNRDWEKQHYG